MAFPVTSKYFLRFRHSDTNLTPVFSLCKRSDTLADVTPPSIVEVGNGTYYFNWTFNAFTDPDLVFEVDGGPSIPTEEVRYIGDTISPKGYYLDEPVSQVKTDVWGDNTVYAAGTKGKRIDDIGASGDASTVASLFGRMLLSRESIRGDAQGTTNGNSVKDVYTRAGAPAGASMSADIAAVESAIATLSGQQSTDLSAIQAKTDLIPNDFVDRLDRMVGLMKENSVLDSTIFDGQGNLQQGRLRLFANSADALAGTAPLATYDITASWMGQNIQNYTMVKRAS